jgi:hypothetical protein
MRYTDWGHIWLDSTALAIDATAVIGLRLARMAMMDSGALAEAQLMVSEKMTAAAELNALALTGGLGHTPHGQASKTIRHLQRKVSSNRKRLSR